MKILLIVFVVCLVACQGNGPGSLVVPVVSATASPSPVPVPLASPTVITTPTPMNTTKPEATPTPIPSVVATPLPSSEPPLRLSRPIERSGSGYVDFVLVVRTGPEAGRVDRFVLDSGTVHDNDSSTGQFEVDGAAFNSAFKKMEKEDNKLIFSFGRYPFAVKGGHGTHFAVAVFPEGDRLVHMDIPAETATELIFRVDPDWLPMLRKMDAIVYVVGTQSFRIEIP